MIAVIAIETDFKWAAGSYAAVSLLSFLIGAPKDAFCAYVFFFGYYAFVKLKLDKIRPKAVGWVVKFAIFIAGALATYFAATIIFGINAEDFGFFGKSFIYVSGILAVVAMAIYDVALKGIYAFYFQKMRKKVLRIMK